MEGFLLTIIVIVAFYLLINKERKEKEYRILKDNEISLLIESCENGNGRSCFEIGREYLWDKGYFGYNQKKALEFSLKGCDAKNYQACGQAEGIYSDINFAGYDIDKAIQCFEKAMELGDTMASDSIARLYIFRKKENVKAAKILSKACDNGEDFSCGRER